MKKVLLFLSILFLPFTVFAYSDYVIPGGHTLGIEVDTNGILIIGFYKIDGKYNKGKPELRVGDYITKVNDIAVDDVNSLTKIIEEASDKRSVKIEFRRDNKIKEMTLPLVYRDGKYKTGLYVKGSIKGIGTLSYIDPQSLIYGALGHEIVESESNDIVEIKNGVIFQNYITGITKSKVGNPGSKLASFNYQNHYGTIEKNTSYGIFGKYQTTLPDTPTLKVGHSKIGDAIIRTVIDNEKIQEFKVEIVAINETSKAKNLTIKIVDENLLKETGGVVQGMSGSPIIQNNEIVGVLTHVIVDNPQMGYGLLIQKMLEEGEK